MSREAAAINAAFLDLMGTGVGPGDSAVAEVVDRHHRHISRWFYECSPQIHVGLGATYASDEGFRTNIDKAGVGLTSHMSQAIAARYSR